MTFKDDVPFPAQEPREHQIASLEQELRETVGELEKADEAIQFHVRAYDLEQARLRKATALLEGVSTEIRAQIEGATAEASHADSSGLSFQNLIDLVLLPLLAIATTPRAPAQPAAPTPVLCTVHGDIEHGKEAEELRTGLEVLLEDDEVNRGSIQRLLDRVDARDSLAYSERQPAHAEGEASAAYTERNRLVALLARIWPSGIRTTEIEGWDPTWSGCCYIDSPAGQLSWHYHDSDAHLFAGLPAYEKTWDGHTTSEKYERVAALPTATAPRVCTPAERAVLDACEGLGMDALRSGAQVSFWPAMAKVCAAELARRNAP